MTDADRPAAEPVFGERTVGSLRSTELQAWAMGLEARLSLTVEGAVIS